MEYAAALMTRGRTLRAASDEHLRLALAGAAEDPDLARTLAAHRPLWGDRIQVGRGARDRGLRDPRGGPAGAPAEAGRSPVAGG